MNGMRRQRGTVGNPGTPASLWSRLTRLTAKGLSVRVRISRMASRSFSGVGCVRPVRMPERCQGGVSAWASSSQGLCREAGLAQKLTESTSIADGGGEHRQPLHQ